MTITAITRDVLDVKISQVILFKENITHNFKF